MFIRPESLGDVMLVPPGLLGSITDLTLSPSPSPVRPAVFLLRLSTSPSASCSFLQSRVPLKSVLNLRRYNLERTLELLEKVRFIPSGTAVRGNAGRLGGRGGLAAW